MSGRISGRIGIIFEVDPVSIDEQHVALPKLYGAPAYARPPAPVAVTPRPFDPDDLPLVAHQSDDELETHASLQASAYAADGMLRFGGDEGSSTTGASSLQPRSLSLRAIAGRLIGSD
jgi:hypothetical protein